MKNIILIAGMVTLLNAAAHADTLYRWVDSEGRVHYGERPEQDAVEITKKKFTAPTVTDDDLLPYESRLARQNFPVTLYVGNGCGEACAQAIAFLNKRGIPFAERFLLSQKEVEDFKAMSGKRGIPTLAVGKTFLEGFEAVQWGSELDIAGYPKTAPIGARPYTPPSRPDPAASSVAPAVPAE